MPRDYISLGSTRTEQLRRSINTTTLLLIQMQDQMRYMQEQVQQMDQQVQQADGISDYQFVELRIILEMLEDTDEAIRDRIVLGDDIARKA